MWRTSVTEPSKPSTKQPSWSGNFSKSTPRLAKDVACPAIKVRDHKTQALAPHTSSKQTGGAQARTMATLLCAAERLRMAVCRLIESSKSKAQRRLPRNSVPAQPCCCCVQLAGGVFASPVVVRSSNWCGG